jgi:cell fate (sporulation/competence/biofilm development) regulator YlbF (YheA/YmcA/DUF963 family)
MIVRILGEGQYEIDAAKLADLNELDKAVEHAIKVDDQLEFRQALTRLLTEVHEKGVPVADDVFTESDLVLPPSDATLAEVTQMLSDEGLLPG